MSSIYTLAVLVALAFVVEGNPVSRIIGGVSVNIYDYPFQASLRSGGSHICGASFIREDWLVTAAHCVDNQNVASLSIGHGATSLAQHKSVAIRAYYMHPQYDGTASGYPNDIALLLLDSPVVFNSNTDKIALPSSDFNAPLEDCIITGWGCSRKGWLGLCTESPDILQGAPMNVLSQPECESAWSTANVINAHVCVKSDVSSGCNGDSGGPLSCLNGNSQPVLAGATSWGSSSCSPASPTVYTRVSEFNDWIRSYVSGV